tara:strand:+ start:45 stop:845 length:801 start_codon:yes stop_codon:yes gene_type:complete
MIFINSKIESLNKYALVNAVKYRNANPFPHIIIDDFFNANVLNKILDDFPKNIEKIGDKIDNKAELKLGLNNTKKFSAETNNFINFLNSYNFIEFLQNITNVEETLISDPYLQGGGFHELKNGGFLNIHSDFNKHSKMKLDRRLNVIIYLNKNWNEHNGGQLELWDKEMKKCSQSIIPKFNRMVIFSTTTYSFHGNPNKVICKDTESRKSIALYYYTNGRPSNEIQLGDHSTIFRKRPGSNDVDGNIIFKKIFGKIYIRKKGKLTK